MGFFRTKRMSFLIAVSTAVLLLITATTSWLGVSAASGFASPAFQQQWNSVEGTIPNFWGPLSTARDGQAEPYLEGSYNGQTGQRLVQYFDKARMEQTTPTSGVSNGLLTVELKSGNLQLGDNSFQQRAAANIGIAGDPGTPGPTYASLGALQEKSPQFNGPVALAYDIPSNAFHDVLPGSDPALAFGAYIADPGGRFGQNVPQIFVNFLNKIPGGYLGSMGYPISPAFVANVQVAGVPNVTVAIQAFQRKVLTYTATNPAAFQVEFGNIGQHYYQWRYTAPTPPTPPTPPAGAISAPSFANVADTSLTVVYSTPAPACGTAEYRVAGNAAWISDIDTFACAAPNAATTQSVDLSGLAPKTTYEVRPAVKGLDQAVAYGPVGTVTTAPATAVEVSSPAVSNLTGTSVTLTFTTSAPTCAVVQYRVHGTSKWGADVDIGALACAAGDASQTHAKNLTGITPGTTLDVRGAAKDVSGVVHYSAAVTFTTPK
jgi:hypothetical protein